MASNIRKKKRSRRQAEARRRWKDVQEEKRGKYTGPWKRRDRRRKAFQTMKRRLKIVQRYRSLRAEGMKEGQAARQAGEEYGYSASGVRDFNRRLKRKGKRGRMPKISVRQSPPRTPWEVIQISLLLRRVLHGGGDRRAAELASREMYQIPGQGVYKLFKRYRGSTRTYHPVGNRNGIQYDRYEATKKNAVWHLDFAGPFSTKKKNGRKCWVLVVVDAYSRLLLT